MARASVEIQVTSILALSAQETDALRQALDSDSPKPKGDWYTNSLANIGAALEYTERQGGLLVQALPPEDHAQDFNGGA